MNNLFLSLILDPNMNPDQQAAVMTDSRVTLVAAAAGSGKTKVLVERIVRLIAEGSRLDRMMICTFTRAAAAEMRARLEKRLKELIDRCSVLMRGADPVFIRLEAEPKAMVMAEAETCRRLLTGALDQIPQVQIGTLHSFCSHLLRKEFQKAGIDPLFSVAESWQTDKFFAEAEKDALNYLLKTDEHAEALRTMFAMLGKEALLENVRTIHETIVARADREEWLDRCCGLSEQSVQEKESLLYESVRRRLTALYRDIGLMQQMAEEKCAPAWARDLIESDKALIDTVLSAEDWESLCVLKKLSFARKTTMSRKADPAAIDWDARYKKHRDALKKEVSDILSSLPDDPALLRLEAEEDLPFRRALAELTRVTVSGVILPPAENGEGEEEPTVLVKGYDERKYEKNLLDYGDLEQKTLLLLRDGNTRSRLQKNYDFIFVDECQDNSNIQNAIVDLLCGEHTKLFRVGDVKQSIYRFRQAAPMDFRRQMNEFDRSGDPDRTLIRMQTNYRSSYTVQQACNQVFEKLMVSDDESSESYTEVSYKGEELNFPESSPDISGEPSCLYAVEAVEDEEEEKRAPDKWSAQCHAAVSIIGEMHSRGIGYGRMAILMPRVAGVGQKVSEYLESSGIPTFFDGKDSFFEMAEIRRTMALLRCICNPREDIALLSALRLPCFHLTDSDLAEIRLCRKGRDVPFRDAFEACCEQDTVLAGKCRRAEESFTRWKLLAEVRPLASFIREVLEETGLFAYFGALTDGALRQNNLKLLISRAEDMAGRAAASLWDFVEEQEILKVSGDTGEAREMAPGQDAVRISTIHKSKGLEYENVIVLGMDGDLVSSRLKDSGLRIHPEMGFALPHMDRKLRIRRKTLTMRAIEARQNFEESCEKIRLLYVAMTRAKQRLYLVGCVKPLSPLPPMPEKGTVLTARTYMDWLQPIYAMTNRLTAHYARMVTFRNEEAVIDLSELNGILDKAPAAHPEWDAQPPENRLLKTSVTGLIREMIYADDNPEPLMEEDEETKRTPEVIRTPFRLSELPAMPAFMTEKNGLTAAERGTAAHRALSLIDLKGLKNASSVPEAIRQEIRRMQESGILTPEEASAVSLRQLSDFFVSGTGKRLLSSSRVEREWSFNLSLPDQGGMLLQGIVDCAFIDPANGQWILMDYKTDLIEDEEAFAERYRGQLNWYARAVETLTGIPVAEKLLISLRLGKTLRL